MGLSQFIAYDSLSCVQKVPSPHNYIGETGRVWCYGLTFIVSCAHHNCSCHIYEKYTCNRVIINWLFMRKWLMSKLPVQIVGDQLCHAHAHSSNSSSIILEDLYHKRSREQEMTSTSLFFEIITYVSSASLLLMLT